MFSIDFFLAKSHRYTMYFSAIYLDLLDKVVEKITNLLPNGGFFHGDFHPMGSQSVNNHKLDKQKLKPLPKINMPLERGSC